MSGVSATGAPQPILESNGNGFHVEAFCANRYIPRFPTGVGNARRVGHKPRFPHVEDGFDG